MMIFNKYINPMGAAHTERLIAIPKKYGFPSVARIKKYYKKEFADEESLYIATEYPKDLFQFIRKP